MALRTKREAQPSAYGFYFQDLDFNWWEIQHEPRKIDDFFGRGDVADMGTLAVETEESHE